MIGERRDEHSLSGMFMFALIGMFAIMALLVAALGVNAYRSVDAKAARDTAVRSSLLYAAGKARALDGGGMEIVDMDGIAALALYEDIEGAKYATYIYMYEGALRELYARADMAFAPQLGQSLARIDAFSAESGDGILTLRATVDGVEHRLALSSRAGEVGE